jgi:type II secretory pathway pseudopilin PulG
MKFFHRMVQDSRFRIQDNSAFTVFELVIFGALFSIISIVLVTVLVSILRVQARQSAAAKVNQQSVIFLQKIQGLVEQSSAIEIPSDTPTSTLKLRMASSSGDPTYLYLQSGTVYFREMEIGSAQPWTSPEVNVSSLTFTKRANARGHDSVAVSFTMQNNTQNLQQQFVQFLQTSVARVSAATFDSNLVPSANNTWKIGTAAQDWQSINNTIYFSGGNVGIGVASPGQTFEVNGGVRLNTVAGKPTCDATQRGTVWMTQSGTGIKDALQVCVKNPADAYIWATIY